MKRIITALVAGVTLLSLTACPPSGNGGSSGGGGGGGPKAGAQGASYSLNLAAQDKRNREVKRIVDCQVTGTAKGKIVTVTDTKTGDTKPYSQQIPGIRTPASLRILDYANVDRIHIDCTMLGEEGDAFFLEVTKGHVIAPLISSVEFDEIGKGGHRAHCYATINASA